MINPDTQASSSLTIRPATQQDRANLARLVHFEVYVHRHLDWKAPLDWIGSTPYLVTEKNKGELVSALACPPDPERVAWIRMFAVASSVSLERAWSSLWPAAASYLAEHDLVDWVAAIPLQKWFEVLLAQSGFEETHHVVMLEWEHRHLQQSRPLPELSIRPMTFDDLQAVSEIDRAAFMPLWRNSLDSLTLAFRQAVIATVAEQDGVLTGYQISTPTPLGGHLARLAVHPAWQKHGIGRGLLEDLLSQFERRGAQSVTVNTQHNNEASLALYKNAGFRLTGEIFPVFEYHPE